MSQRLQVIDTTVRVPPKYLQLIAVLVVGKTEPFTVVSLHAKTKRFGSDLSDDAVSIAQYQQSLR